MSYEKALSDAAKRIAKPVSTLVFTGAGISVESGIPPFRGQGGLWAKYNPEFIHIDYFHAHPRESWRQIREIFYDHWGKAEPNPAHDAIAEMEKCGWIDTLVTQNIDCLHQRAGSKDVVEFHGTLDRLNCTKCDFHCTLTKEILEQTPPYCPKCGALMKPDFVFFGEMIPPAASERSFQAAEQVDTVLVVGTSGEVMPACQIPQKASINGAVVIEVNPEPSAFTRTGITDIFLQGKASIVLPALLEACRCV